MTFINAGALIALSAAAIPVLIHLFSRQRHREVEFSTLKFLKRLEYKRLRRLKIAELLILLLRIMAVGCIAAAFSRPALQRISGFFQGEADTAALLVIDNSLHSQAMGPAGSIIAEERQIAAQALKMFSSNDRVAVIGANPPVQAASVNFFPGDDERLRRRIFDLESFDAASGWEGVLEGALELFKKSDRPNKELYLFSPFYGGFEAPDSIAAQFPENNIRVFRVETGPERLANIAILDVAVESRIIQPDIPVSLKVNIANFSGERRENIPLSLFMGDVRVASTDLTIPPHDTIQVSLKVVPEGGGFTTGCARLEIDDALSADNRSYYTFYVPPGVEVYLAGDSLEISRVELALNPKGGREYSVIPTKLESLNRLGEYPGASVVFLIGVESISPYIAGFLREILRNGGGVLISPSEASDIASLNREFLQATGCPQFGELVSEGETSWGNIDYRHPLFEGVFGEGPALDSPRFSRYFRLMGPGGSDIIDFRGGLPYLREVAVGEGRILIFSAGFSDFWGDISQRGIFAPLIHKAALYLGSHIDGGAASITAGEPIQHISEPANGGFSILKPDGERIELLPTPEAHSLRLKYQHTGSSGIYRLLRGDDISAVFAVNPAVEASRLQRVDGMILTGEVIISPEADIGEAVSLGRVGTELWRWFLALALLFLVSELVIARLVK